MQSNVVHYQLVIVMLLLVKVTFPSGLCQQSSKPC